MADFLKLNDVKFLSISGHTDETENANLDLSRRRANRLIQFLIVVDMKTKIMVQEFGETRPPRISDPKLYNEEKIQAIARRTEISFDEN